MVHFKMEEEKTEPTTPSRGDVDDDLVTISITVPRSVIDRNKIDVTLTPHSQRTASANRSEGTARTHNPGTPPATPRHGIPRFNLPGRAPFTPSSPANSQVGEDPFVVPQNDCGGSRVSVTASYAADANDTDHDNPYLVYPLPAGRTIEELPFTARRPRGYFVVTKGSKIGVFYDVWNNVEPISMRDAGGIFCRAADLDDAKNIWDKARVKRVLRA